MQVTEQDFRRPEYRNAKAEDYEFRADGKVVRKDRWETAIRKIASRLNLMNNREFEIDDVVAEVFKLDARIENLKKRKLRYRI